MTEPVSPVGRFDLNGRVTVVTGASRGIGRDLALQLAGTGAVVVPTVRDQAAADALAAAAHASGLTVHPVLLDVRDVPGIRRAVESIVADHGGVDVLVNNAGVGDAHQTLEVTERDWDDMMAVNLKGMFFVSQAAARTMIEAGRPGRIVNISSQGGQVGLPNAAVYCTSKGGVNMMTKVLALEWAAHDITVNAVAPTFVYTPGTAPILDDPEQRAQVLSKIPLGRLGLTEDVCSAVVYLASAAGRMVTGTVLVVDGGWTAQ